MSTCLIRVFFIAERRKGRTRSIPQYTNHKKRGTVILYSICVWIGGQVVEQEKKIVLVQEKKIYDWLPPEGPSTSSPLSNV